MLKLLLVSAAFALLTASAARGQEGGFPSCTEDELLVFVNSMFDFELLRPPPIESIDDLAEFATGRIEAREDRLLLVPLCAEAIALQRQDIAFTGDIIGRIALNMAAAPDRANPYVLRLPDGEDRLQTNLGTMSNADDSGAVAEADRPLSACTFEENAALDALSLDFLAKLSAAEELSEGAGLLPAVDQMLQWREEELLTLPDCLEAIEVGFRLTEAATDATARFALSYAQVDEDDNPYIKTVNAARAALSSWREDMRLAGPGAEASVLVWGRASQLPSCSRAEIADVYDITIDETRAVLASILDIESLDGLSAYAKAHLDLRAGSLSELPLCEEIFEFSWLARQLLGDVAGFATFRYWNTDRQANPFNEQATNTELQANRWIEDSLEYLNSDNAAAGPAPDERLIPACRDGEIVYMIAYLARDFRGFLHFAFNLKTATDRAALFERSFALRDRLWVDLPRCQEALEIGMLMRQIASDSVTLQLLDVAGVSLQDNAYLAEFQNDVEEFETLRAALVASSSLGGRAQAEGQTYYVSANPYANIRACASTDCAIVASAQNGEAITVVDDSSDWYEIRLKDGGTGYIAGFLASKTRP